MKVNICNRKKIEKEAANLIVQKIRETLKKKSKAILAIPGGSSVEPIFKEICKSKLDKKRVHIFLVDERLVPLASNQSNYDLVKNYFLDSNLHFFNYYNSPRSYYEFLKKHGGKFDIVLLSAGEDGHVASLFPNHKSIKSKAEGYILVKDSPKPPSQRISASKRLIQKSKTAVLLFFKESKEASYRKFMDPSITEIECPAKLVKKIKDLHVFHAFC